MKAISLLISIVLMVALSSVANAAPETTATRLMGAGIPAGAASQLLSEFAPIPAIATPASTPAAVTNEIKAYAAVVPTTAANNAVLLKPTPVAGDRYTIHNQGANAVRIKAGGAGTINGSAAGAYIPLATKQTADCINLDGTAWACSLLTVPTPAGP